MSLYTPSSLLTTPPPLKEPLKVIYDAAPEETLKDPYKDIYDAALKDHLKEQVINNQTNRSKPKPEEENYIESTPNKIYPTYYVPI